MGIVGCYTLDIYCDSPDHALVGNPNEPAQFVARSAEGCRRQAQEAGWLIRKDGEGMNEGTGVAVCPICLEFGLKGKPPERRRANVIARRLAVGEGTLQTYLENPPCPK
jgi:hypothetical protein